MFPEWQGDLFVGSLKFDYISRLAGEPVAEVEQLQNADTRRVRDIREAPDGSIWFISEDRKGIFRISR
jgi:glucose/arabinose dehydrogenase